MLEPSPFPVISLYLDLTAAHDGRERHDDFLRKAFNDRVKGMPLQSPERESFETDFERIHKYLDDEVSRSSNGCVLFACAGADLFEAIQLEAPLGEHWLFVGSVPHLYPLARLIDTYPRYAAVVLDSNKAQIFVFGLAAKEREERVVNPRTRKSRKGGWSQARYQRRADNIHLLHVKEVVDTLEKVVRAERIQQILVAGEQGATTILLDQLPKELKEKVVDIGTWDRAAGETDILHATLDALREKDAETDAEKVEALIAAWQGGGLGVAGPEASLTALQRGQVDELIITADPAILKPVQQWPDDAVRGALQAETSSPDGPTDESKLKLSDELVTRAQRSAARIRFIEDPSLLADIGGVGALLRFRI